MKTKTFRIARVKAGEADGMEDGQFEAVVAVFNNIDSYGDKILPGFFADSLKAWADSGDPIPVIWSHQWTDPDAHIGYVVEAKELLPGDAALPPALADLGGLWVRGQLDVGEEDAAKAKKIHRLMKARRITQFSFAYDVEEDALIRPEDGEAFWELRKGVVYEVGPCLIGVNQDTELLDIKSLRQKVAAKAGRTLSAANEATLNASLDDIDSAVGRIKSVLEQVANTDDSKATANEPAASPAASEVREPMRSATAPGSDLAVLELELLAELASA